MSRKTKLSRNEVAPSPKQFFGYLTWTAVLKSLTSADAQRGHRHAIDEFPEWNCSEPRLSFGRTVVLR